MRERVCVYSATPSIRNIHFLRYVFDVIVSRDASGDYPVVFCARMLFNNSMNDERNCVKLKIVRAIKI